MLHGLSITYLDRFLGRIFSQFVRTRMGVLGIDTFSKACSFPGSFQPCADLPGVSLSSMASVSPIWTAFWAAFFHNFLWTRMGVLGIDTFSRACSFPGSFRPRVGPQGVNYAPWPAFHLVWTASCEMAILDK